MRLLPLSLSLLLFAAGIPRLPPHVSPRRVVRPPDVPPAATANEIVKVNERSRIDGLRSAAAVLTLLALVARHRCIPTTSAESSRIC